MATDDAASEIIRPRRRGEPRPEPEPSVPAEVGGQAEASEVEAEQPPAQLPVQPLAEPEPPPAQPVQAAQPVAEITRACSFCFTQQPLARTAGQTLSHGSGELPRI